MRTCIWATPHPLLAHTHIWIIFQWNCTPPHTYTYAHACTQSSAFTSFHRWDRTAFTARGKKLSLKRLVRALTALYRLPDGSRWKRWCAGCEGSETIFVHRATVLSVYNASLTHTCSSFKQHTLAITLNEVPQSYSVLGSPQGLSLVQIVYK